MNGTVTEYEGQRVYVEYKDFWQYIADKKITRDEVMTLSIKKRRELYLLWKHGFNNPTANEEAEETKQMVYFRDRHVDLEQIPVEWKQWIKNEREFEVYCFKIKGEIGLMVKDAHKPAPKPVEQPHWQA